MLRHGGARSTGLRSCGSIFARPNGRGGCWQGFGRISWFMLPTPVTARASLRRPARSSRVRAMLARQLCCCRPMRSSPAMAARAPKTMTHVRSGTTDAGRSKRNGRSRRQPVRSYGCHCWCRSNQPTQAHDVSERPALPASAWSGSQASDASLHTPSRSREPSGESRSCRALSRGATGTSPALNASRGGSSVPALLRRSTYPILVSTSRRRPRTHAHEIFTSPMHVPAPGLDGTRLRCCTSRGAQPVARRVMSASMGVANARVLQPSGPGRRVAGAH